jgi:hypothetical protein
VIDWTPFLVAIGLMGSFLAYMLGATMWLSRQFFSLKSLIYEQTEQTKQIILDKLEYHERHDDERFQNIVKDIWQIRVRNASIDKLHDDADKIN